MLGMACAAVGLDRGAFSTLLGLVQELNGRGKPGGDAEYRASGACSTPLVRRPDQDQAKAAFAKAAARRDLTSAAWRRLALGPRAWPQTIALRLSSRVEPSLAFVAACGERPAGDRQARDRLAARYGCCRRAGQAQVIVALGGDGFMIETMQRTLGRATPIYGMNQGSVGFLMNDYNEERLLERIAAAEQAVIHPLVMTTTDDKGGQTRSGAGHQRSLPPAPDAADRQAAHLRRRQGADGGAVLRRRDAGHPGGIHRLQSLRPRPNHPARRPRAGADANQRLPAEALARRAAVAHPATVRFDVLEPDKRPVSAVADNFEVRRVVQVDVCEDRETALVMLFDAGRSLEERVLAEQFSG